MFCVDMAHFLHVFWLFHYFFCTYFTLESTLFAAETNVYDFYHKLHESDELADVTP